MKNLFLFILITVVLFLNEVKAQGCCTAGTSTFGGIERGVETKDNLIFDFGYYYNSLNNTYQSTELISDPLNRKASVTSINLEMEFGLENRVSILALINYSVRERETTIRSAIDNTTSSVKFKGQGFGDMVLLVKYELVKATIVSPFSIGIGGGLKLPTGSYTKENQGTRLSIDMQPGTGAADILAWFYAYKGFPEIHLNLISSILYRYPGSNLDGYRYGDELLINLGSEYGITEFLGVTLLLKGRYAAGDFWGGRFLPSTGGYYFDVIPGINYYEGNFTLRLFYQTPLFRNIEGIQLTTSAVFGTEFKYSLNLN